MRASRPYSKERRLDGSDDVSRVGMTSSSAIESRGVSSSSAQASTSPVGDEQYTFDLFIAVAMLIQMREDLFRCNGEFY